MRVPRRGEVLQHRRCLELLIGSGPGVAGLAAIPVLAVDLLHVLLSITALAHRGRRRP